MTSTGGACGRCCGVGRVAGRGVCLHCLLVLLTYKDSQEVEIVTVLHSAGPCLFGCVTNNTLT